MKNYKIQSYIAMILFCMIAVTSCKESFEKMVPGSDENTDTIKYKTPKVLYLIVDGARGASVRNADAPNIKSLINHAIYTWNSISDTSKNDATNWADMMTGVKKEKHEVTSENFSGNNLEDYPVIFERIKTIYPNFRIASFASSDLFKQKLTGGADVSESFNGNDAAVTSRMVNFLKADTASIVVGQFSEVEAAGKAYGFDNQYPQYEAAIKSFDGKVGELMAAIKSRANYDNENWLIIVTSNRGGQYTLPVEEDDKTLFSNTNANTFTIYYNMKYNPTFIGRPFLGNTYSGSAVRFRGEPDKSQAVLPTALSNAEFNFGTSTDFTISVKIKKGKNPRNTSRGEYYYAWPSFLGKRNNNDWGKQGWNFNLFYNGWRFFAAGGQDNSNGDEVGGLDFSGDTWHDLTAVVETKADGNRYIRLYTDGVKGITNKDNATPAKPTLNDFKLTGKPNYDNTDPLTVGYTTGQFDGDYGMINVQLAELKIWKKALSEEVIKQYSCDPTMDESHPDYNYLIGYWPMVDGAGTTMEDKGPFATSLELKGTYQWENFTDLMCSPSNTNLGTLVPKNSDMPTQILSWFNIPRKESWNLDGRVWIAN